MSMDERPPIPTATIPFAKRPKNAPPADQVDQYVGELARRQMPAEIVIDHAPPAEPQQPTDIQFVANSLDCLRHLDLKDAVIGMLGKEMPKDVNEAIDRVAEWAAANKTKAPACAKS